jgi:hypothetical protein
MSVRGLACPPTTASCSLELDGDDQRSQPPEPGSERGGRRHAYATATTVRGILHRSLRSVPKGTKSASPSNDGKIGPEARDVHISANRTAVMSLVS